MNTPSPLIPQGTLPGVRGKSHIRIAVITILAVHVVLLLALLMAGCKKTSDQVAKNDGAPGDIAPPFDPTILPTNPPSTPPPPAPSNAGTALVTPTPISLTPTPAPAVTSFDGTDHVVIKGDSFYT